MASPSRVTVLIWATGATATTLATGVATAMRLSSAPAVALLPVAARVNACGGVGGNGDDVAGSYCRHGSCFAPALIWLLRAAATSLIEPSVPSAS